MVINASEFTGTRVKAALGAKKASKFYNTRGQKGGTFGMCVTMKNGKEYRFDVFYGVGGRVYHVILGTMSQRYGDILTKTYADGATFAGLMKKARNYIGPN